jgi:hypothetical protein
VIILEAEIQDIRANCVKHTATFAPIASAFNDIDNGDDLIRERPNILLL